MNYKIVIVLLAIVMLLPVATASTPNPYSVTYVQTNHNIQISIIGFANTSKQNVRASYYLGTTLYLTQVFNSSLSFSAPLENGVLIITAMNGTILQQQNVVYQNSPNTGTPNASPLGTLTLLGTIMILGSAFAGYIGSKLGSRGKIPPINSGMYKGKYFGAEVERINKLGTEEVNTPDKASEMFKKAEALKNKYGKITPKDLKGGDVDEI